MHMAGAGAEDAIVNPPALPVGAAAAALADLAWQRLRPEGWPLPREAFPAGSALVGGAVRDALLDRLGPAPDLDLVVEGDAIQLCRQLSRRHGGSAVVLDPERSIARLVIRGWSVDLARQEGGSLEADLHRRDYTINAMALPLDSRAALVDPLGGADHLAAGLLVAVAEANLLDDPLRLLRGLRLAAELGFRLEQRSQAWIEQHHSALQAVAGERVLAELEKMAAAATGQRSLADSLRWGLLEAWRPDADRDPLEPQQQLEGLTAEQARQRDLSPEEWQRALPLARLAAALDGPSLRALRSSRKLQQRVERLRHWQLRLRGHDPAGCAEALPEADRLQLQRDLEDDLPALLLHWDSPQARSWLRRWRDADDRLFHPRPAIDGRSLQQELRISASPRLGELLHHLMLEQAFGRVHNRSDALEAARNWLAFSECGSEMAPRRD